MLKCDKCKIESDDLCSELAMREDMCVLVVKLCPACYQECLKATHNKLKELGIPIYEEPEPIPLPPHSEIDWNKSQYKMNAEELVEYCATFSKLLSEELKIDKERISIMPTGFYLYPNFIMDGKMPQYYLPHAISVIIDGKAITREQKAATRRVIAKTKKMDEMCLAKFKNINWIKLRLDFIAYLKRKEEK